MDSVDWDEERERELTVKGDSSLIPTVHISLERYYCTLESSGVGLLVLQASVTMHIEWIGIVAATPDTKSLM